MSFLLKLFFSECFAGHKTKSVIFSTFSLKNGPAGNKNTDTAVCQQVGAVSYSQEGSLFSGLDGTLKSLTDTKISALTGPGVAVMGPYTGGAPPGVSAFSPEVLDLQMLNISTPLPLDSCCFITSRISWQPTACHSQSCHCSDHGCGHTGHTGAK